MLAGGASHTLCSVFANLPLNKDIRFTNRQRSRDTHTHTHAAVLCLQIQPKTILPSTWGDLLALALAAIHILHQNITDSEVKSLTLSPPAASDP